jgi:8-oxo-dGTP pyrophosphatase MutT (NUDIX family)
MEERWEPSQLERISAALEPSLSEPHEGASAMVRAAVALLLRERERGLEIFVIKRAEKGDDPWSGHMALPGGREEPEDENPYETARRETLEEVGMDIAEGRLLGRLDDLGPRAAGRSLVVSTVVVALDAEAGRLDPREVEEAMWVPVEELVDSPVEIADFPGEWPAYTYRDRYVIWGLTHRILDQLWKLAGGAPGH